VREYQALTHVHPYTVNKSPVTPVILHGEPVEACNLVIDLRNNFHIFCSVVVYPVVPKDVIMLRIIPTAMHTLEDVDETIEAFETIKVKLVDGTYHSPGWEDVQKVVSM